MADVPRGRSLPPAHNRPFLMNRSQLITPLLIAALFFAIGMKMVHAWKEDKAPEEARDPVVASRANGGKARGYDAPAHRPAREASPGAPGPVLHESNIMAPRNVFIANLRGMFPKGDRSLRRMEEALDLLGATEDQKNEIQALIDSSKKEMDSARQKHTKHTKVSEGETFSEMDSDAVNREIDPIIMRIQKQIRSNLPYDKASQLNSAIDWTECFYYEK